MRKNNRNHLQLIVFVAIVSSRRKSNYFPTKATRMSSSQMCQNSWRRRQRDGEMDRWSYVQVVR